MLKTSDTFSANAAIFGKVYFPRLVIPVSSVITNLITFAIQFFLFLAFLAFFYLAGANNPAELAAVDSAAADCADGGPGFGSGVFSSPR